MACCAEPAFKLEEDLGHVESVDWDLGTCETCNTALLRQWSEYAPNSVYLDPLTPAEAARFRGARDRERLNLLKQWYADH